MKKCSLGDLITFQRGHDLPKSSMIPGEYPVVGSNGIIGYHNEFTTEAPSISVGRSGNVGNPFIYNGRTWSHNTSLYIKEFKDCDPIFIYYLLKTLDLGNYAGGSAVPTLNRNHIHALSVAVPEGIEDQRRIARLLRMLDDKIELNHHINDNLLDQAQTLYKQHFPYSVQNDLPDGWRIGTVGEIIEIHDSKRIPLSGADRMKMEKKIYPYYGAASLMDYVDNYIFDGKYLLLGEDGTVVDDAGYPILQYVWGQFWVNNHAHILTGRLGFNVESLYMLFKQTPVKSIVTGAVQPKISQANLRSVQVVIPPEHNLKEYNDLVEPLFSLLRANEEECKSLAALRDTLLPKLMSGEIDVSDIQL